MPRWYRGSLPAGDLSLVLLIEITPRDAKHYTIAVCLYLNAERIARGRSLSCALDRDRPAVVESLLFTCNLTLSSKVVGAKVTLILHRSKMLF